MGELVDIQVPIGMDFENDECRMYNGTGVALVEGSFVVVDETKTGADGSAAANTTTNQSLNLFTAVRLFATADLTTLAVIGAWAQEAIPIAGIGRFRVNGTTKVRLAADLAANTQANLTGTNGVLTMTVTTTTAQKVFAKAAIGQTAVVAATSNFCQAYGKGITGFGGTI